MAETLEQLNKRVGIPGVAEIAADRGGLPAVWIQGKGDGITGSVYLHGAHVATWRPAGFDEVLFLSSDSAWEVDKPIRGGVPVIFPWFGPRTNPPPPPVVSPMHGFARLRSWDVESIKQVPAGVEVCLTLTSDDATRATWPFDFRLRHRVTFGEELSMALEITNTGKMAFTAEEAQHTYFSLGDVRKARVLGLNGVRYIDKTDNMQEKVQEGDITITAETDRIYLDTTGPITVEDAAKRRRIVIRKENSRATVVWNPWIAKAKAMADFGDDEWPEMICVETCNVNKFPIDVAPGQTHTMSTRVRIEAL